MPSRPLPTTSTSRFVSGLLNDRHASARTGALSAKSSLRLTGLGEVHQVHQQAAEVRYILLLPFGKHACVSGELLLVSGVVLPIGPTLTLTLTDGRQVNFHLQPTSLVWGAYRIVGSGLLR